MSKPWQSASRKADPHVTLGMTLFGRIFPTEAVALHEISTQNKDSPQARSGRASGTLLGCGE